MKRSYKFRIYPDEKQEVKLNRTLSTCRHLYNGSLEERRRQAELNNLCRDFEIFPWGKPEWISYEDQANDLAASKTQEQKEVFSQVLQDVLRRLDKTFKNFYRGFGYPRFKGRNRYDSFTYPQKGFAFKDGKLNLSKIGSIRIFQHREIEGTIKTCTIKKDIDQWYAVFTVEIEKQVEQVPIETTAGADAGLRSLLTLSDGKQIDAPEFLRTSEEKLAHEQKRLSRKKKGSANRQKQRVIVARVHRKIRNQRKDFAHKTSRTLINNYDLIAFENLNIKGMVQNHHLAKSISQKCCICGNVEHLTLADRVFRCSKCGNVKDRDHNAAINIEHRAVGTDCAELTPVESTHEQLVEAGSSVL